MKKLIATILLAVLVMAGYAKDRVTVWKQPTTEFCTSCGDGFFSEGGRGAGRLLDLDVDPRELDKLARLLEQM